MNTFCLNRKAYENEINLLASTLSKSQADLDQNKSFYTNIAYHALCCNNGHPMNLDPQKNVSKLYRYLLDKYAGSERRATIAKLEIYTPQFMKKYGDWLNVESPNGIISEEPDIITLKSPEELEKNIEMFAEGAKDVEQFFDDVAIGNIFLDIDKLDKGLEPKRNEYVNKKLKDEDIQAEFDKFKVDYYEHGNPLLTDTQTAEILDSIRAQFVHQYRAEWNRLFIKEKVESIIDILAKSWAFKLENDKSVNIDLNDPSIPDYIKVRAEVINILAKHKEDHRNINAIATIIYKYIQGTATDPITLSKSLISAYADIIKNTVVAKNYFLQHYGIDTSDKKLTERAKGRFIKEFIKESEYFLVNKKTTEINHVFLDMLYKMKGLIHQAFHSLSNTIRTKILKKEATPFVKGTFSLHNERRELVKNLLLYALGQLDLLMEESVDFILSASNYAGSNMIKSLEMYRNNIERRIKSLTSLLQRGTGEPGELDQLKSLKFSVEQAIKSGKEQDANVFYDTFLKTASKQLRKSLLIIDKYKDYLNNGRFQDINLQKIVHIMVDIVDAYLYTLENVIYMRDANNKLHWRPTVKEFEEGGDFRLFVETVLLVELSNTKTRLDQLIKEYLEQYVTYAIDETLGRVVNGTEGESSRRMRDTFVDNAVRWLNGEIHNGGEVGFFDKYVLPARVNESPIIRIIVDKFKLIDQMTQNESAEIYSKLETIRTEYRSAGDRWTFNNYLGKYCEVDEDGWFTGNWVSDVNYGQYLKEYADKKQELYKKYNFVVNPVNGKFESTDEKSWLMFNIELIAWQGGGEAVYNKDTGRYEFKKTENRPRIHRRFLPLYYIDRVQILGKDASEYLSELNRQIQDIYELCSRNITYKKDGKTLVTRVPITTDLEDVSRSRLFELLDEKQQITSPYKMQIDYTTRKILDISEKSDVEIEQSKKFLAWNEWKKQNYGFDESDAEPDFTIYLAILDDFDQQIKELEEQIKTIPINTLSYLDLLNQIDTLRLKKLLFIKDNTATKVNVGLYQALKELKNEIYDVTHPNTLRYSLLLALKKAIISYISKSQNNRYRDLSLMDITAFERLHDIEEEMATLEKNTGEKALRIKNNNKKQEFGRYEWQLLFETTDVMLLDDDGNPTSTTYYSVIASKIKLMYGGGRTGMEKVEKILNIQGGSKKLSIFSQSVPKISAQSAAAIRQYLMRKNKENPNFDITKINDQVAWSLLLVTVPIHTFSHSESKYIDPEFDDSITQYYLVDKTRYDNSAKYKGVKDDPFYKQLLEIMEIGWNNYSGINRGWLYKMPQRETDLKSIEYRNMMAGRFGKMFTEPFRNIFLLTTRDTNVNNELLLRPDGSTVETIPTRWINGLLTPYYIDTDLVSLVGDFVQESIRYKHRKQISPLMELFNHQLSNSNSPQADVLRSEMSKSLYGRLTIGSGKNGRITEGELILLKSSEHLRKLTHDRLMGHNWTSVLKNSWDSFWNLISTATTGKYIMLLNFIHAIGHMGFSTYDDLTNIENILTGFATPWAALASVNRSKSLTMTQALMLYNGVGSVLHDRYKNQHKWGIRRALDKFSTLEFEGIDYTAKAIITEAVYDMYRFVYNPKTQQYEFLNEYETELAYDSYSTGYKVWNKAKKQTLRKAYKMQTVTLDKKNKRGEIFQKTVKTGMVTFADSFTFKDKDGNVVILDQQQLINAIRPLSKTSFLEDKTSRVLENKVKNTIDQLSLTVNGMLHEQDKSSLERHYLGALVVSFRGWMVSQASEYYKDGDDFWDYDTDDQKGSSTYMYNRTGKVPNVELKANPTLMNDEFIGQYDFNTGTIGKGLHKGLFKLFWKNLHIVLAMMVEPIWNYKGGKAVFLESSEDDVFHLNSTDEVYKLRNIASALNSMAVTAMIAYWLCKLCGDDSDKWYYALLYSSVVASISERFPQLGSAAWLSGALEIIKSLTVSYPVVENFHYMFKSFAFMTSDEEKGKKEITNGSYKGRTVKERADTETFTSLGNFVGADILSYLLIIDLIRTADDDFLDSYAPKSGNFRDYHANYYKSTSAAAAASKLKFYKDLMQFLLVNAGTRLFNIDMAPEKEKETKLKSSTKKSTPYMFI